ncbi:MAG: hypothetical protein Q8933_00535 [Bacteroidota bacterium]|nr:hypothetical protein [Bacteroidota bacterium]MDP4190588.1 hypothetical protein [Bacteroidota bacterium]MDP4194247.1 hypothetical protein [Bacteroidota bacterium]
MNMISDIVNDETYRKLLEARLLDTTQIRNHYIRHRFEELKSAGNTSGKAFDKIQEEFNYLSPEMIRKIVYTHDFSDSKGK